MDRQHRGYVYLVKSVTGNWKIGKSANPYDCIRTFEVKLPFEIELEHTIFCYNMDKLEFDLHEVFASKRVNGEWFKLSRRDVKWIKQFSHQAEFESHCKESHTSSIHYVPVIFVEPADLLKLNDQDKSLLLDTNGDSDATTR